MVGNLTDEERKWILKTYWKCENAEKVCQKWTETFKTCATFMTDNLQNMK